MVASSLYEVSVNADGYISTYNDVCFVENIIKIVCLLQLNDVYSFMNRRTINNTLRNHARHVFSSSVQRGGCVLLYKESYVNHNGSL